MLTNFPNGLTSFGIPQVGAGVSIPARGGTVWFVDAATGADSTSGGQNPSEAFATIQHAIDMAGNGTGDTIYVFPGSYAENLSVTKDYLTIKGAVIPGYARPDVTPTTGMALSVHAQGFACEHVRFVGTGVGGIGVQQSGNGFIYTDCVFESDSNIGCRLYPDPDNDSFTASEGIIDGCLIRDCAGGGMSFENPGAPAGVGVTDVVVSNCRFYNNTGADIFDVQNGTLYTVQTTVITGCQFATKNPTKYIDLSAGAATNSGLISNNFFAFSTVGGLTTGEIVLGNDIVFSGNFDATGVVDGHTF